MREEVVETWDKLTECLWDKSFDSASGKWRPYTAFRGLAKRHANLQTSLQRLGGDLRWKERRVIDSFKMYARDDLRHGLTDWHVLLLGQHYRLPTRLLDWTSSPLAAMYFVSEKHPAEDGEIWCVERLKTNDALSPTFASLLDIQGTKLFSLETLSGEFTRMEKFDDVEPLPAKRSLLFFEPPSVSPRIANQYAFFSVMPGPESSADEWLEAHDMWCWKIVVRAKLKKEIRQRLMVMNISERTIYPGLDGVSQWLKAYYQD